MKDRVAALPDRQREVLRLVSLGCDAPEIAAILGIAQRTAINHRDRLMQALGVNKAALLVRIAIKHRVSSLNDRLTAAEKRKSGRRRDGWN
jgi:DNA-binding CsgD family transcriptional regulator